MKKILLVFACTLLLFESFSQNENEAVEVRWYESPIYTRNYESLRIQRNDTIFSLRIYPNKSKVDSVIYGGYATKITKSKWRTNTKEDGSYSIAQYKKVKPSLWFQENNGKYFQAESEYILKKVYKILSSNGDIIKFYYFFNWNYYVKKIETKKEKEGQQDGNE